MPEVHLPNLEEEPSQPRVPEQPQQNRRPHWLRLLLEVLLISTGVFLGLMGEQWRENRHHHEQAETALRLIRAELAANREAVSGVQDYHSIKSKELKAYLSADTATRKQMQVSLQGVKVSFFDRTAWDMTLTTGTLNYFNSDLTFELSRIYTLQQTVSDLTRGLTQAMYIRPPYENMDGFLGSVEVYYDDVTLMEPKLIKAYDEILPKLDLALGTSPPK